MKKSAVPSDGRTSAATAKGAKENAIKGKALSKPERKSSSAVERRFGEPCHTKALD